MAGQQKCPAAAACHGSVATNAVVPYFCRWPWLQSAQSFLLHGSLPACHCRHECFVPCIALCSSAACWLWAYRCCTAQA